MLWLIGYIVVALGLWVWVVRPQLKKYKAIAGVLDEIDTASLTLLGKVKIALIGAWHYIVGVIGGFFEILPNMLPGLKDFNWGAFFNAETAAKITGVICIALMIAMNARNRHKDIAIEPKKD
jgi:hypothetical protein